MGIRKARTGDWKAIASLMDQLEYPGTERFLKGNIATMIDDPREQLLVYEEDEVPDGPILGCISLHFIPQLALEGDFARISYFSIDDQARSKGVGRQMEEYCTKLARDRGCHLIEVHCHSRRTRAHAFYFRQGYKESPKYLIKNLK